MEETAQEQLENSKVPKQLRKYVFKKGISGNPGGRPEGSKSMKQYAKEYLESMPEEDRVDFLNNIDPKIVWEMSEGKPKQDVEHGGVVTISHVLDSLEDDSGQETLGQGVEDQPPVQDQEQAAAVGDVQAEQGSTPLQPEQMVPEHNPEIPPTGVHNG